MEKVRIDKWLWSVRIFKSRTLATEACKESKVKLNGDNAKPSADVRVGDVLQVKKGGFNLTYKVLALIETRVSAELAKPCYEDQTPAEELNKFNAWFVSEVGNEKRERGAGRPTKKDRREIDDFKEGD
jgi:ribosome-associated heat shock protein Hsp15